MLSIVSLTEDGQEKCHEWSEAYPGYDHSQTEERFSRAVKEGKPCSCRFIRNVLGFNCPEGGCSNCGRTVKGPIAFSFYTKQEQAERLLEDMAQSAITFDEALEEKNLGLAAYARDNDMPLYLKLKKKYRTLGIGARDFEKSVRDAGTVDDAKGKPGEAHGAGGGLPEELLTGLALGDENTSNLRIPDKWILSSEGLSRIASNPSGAYVEKVAGNPILITKRIEDLSDGSTLAHHAVCKDHAGGKLRIGAT